MDGQQAAAALALGVVQIAAQLVGLGFAQGFLLAQLHADAGGLFILPADDHVPGAGLVGGLHAGAAEVSALHRAADDKGLALLHVHAHLHGEGGIFVQQFLIH